LIVCPPGLSVLGRAPLSRITMPNFFTPKPLLAPTLKIGVTSTEYEDYVKAYHIYVNTLGYLQATWKEGQKRRSSRLKQAHKEDQDLLVLKQPGRVGVVLPSGERLSVTGQEVSYAMADRQAAGRIATPEEVSSRVKAKRRRYRKNKALRNAEYGAKLSSLKAKIAKNERVEFKESVKATKTYAQVAAILPEKNEKRAKGKGTMQQETDKLLFDMKRDLEEKGSPPPPLPVREEKKVEEVATPSVPAMQSQVRRSAQAPLSRVVTPGAYSRLVAASAVGVAGAVVPASAEIGIRAADRVGRSVLNVGSSVLSRRPHIRRSRR